MQSLFCDRLDYFIEKFYTNNLTKFSAAVQMKYQQVQLYTTKKESQRIPSLDVITRMELSGANKVWLAFGEGEIFNRNNVGKIIQMLFMMQDHKDIDMLRNAFVHSLDFVSRSIESLSTDPSRSMVYRVDDLPRLKGELESIKILAALHLRESIGDDFGVANQINTEQATQNEIQQDKEVENVISDDIEAIIQRTARVTAEEIYRKMREG